MEVKKNPVKLTYEDLRTYTDNFSEENYIGEFQFGKVYHGKITLPGSAQPKRVTIKMWGVPNKWYKYYKNDNAHRLMDELNFLGAPDISHPGLMKPYGYCLKTEQCGIVYDFKALNTVFNLAPTDEFKWSQRIKVALKFAHLLRFLHVNYKGKSPLLIRNIHAAHVMVDEDWNPILYDFGTISGCMFPDKWLFPYEHFDGCYGSEEPVGKPTQKSDVYAFGVVLLCLIMKEVYTDEEKKRDKPTMVSRAFNKYRKDLASFRKSKVKYRSDLLWYEEDEILAEVDDENFHFSLVHKSLEADESFYSRDGPTISRLAQACSETFPELRPTMNQVVNQLQKLEVVRRNPQLNVYIEGKEKMKRENIPFGKLKVKKDDIPSKKMEVKTEDIPSEKMKVKKENIPSQKMKVKKENIPSEKMKLKKENIPSCYTGVN